MKRWVLCGTEEYSGYASLDEAIEDGYVFRTEAFDAEMAAQEFAEDYDGDGDYALSNGAEVEVWVREDGKMGHPPQLFIVWAEPSVEYYSREITDG